MRLIVILRAHLISNWQRLFQVKEVGSVTIVWLFHHNAVSAFEYEHKAGELPVYQPNLFRMVCTT